MDDFNVDQQSAAVAAMAENWPVIDALTGGTLAMRKAGKKLLPQWPKEDDDSYKERIATAVLFNAFSRTTEVLAAKPFARPMQIDGVSKNVEGMFENIDMLGTDLHGFCAQVMMASLRYGLHGCLVDSPKAEGVRTRADEKKAGVRPYLTQYPCTSILGWRAKHNADGTYLTQLRLKEDVVEVKGAWGEEKVEQVRVLEPGKWEVWRQARSKDGVRTDWQIFEQGTTTLDRIPFVFFYGLRDGFGIGRPPLLDLAYMNVEHWQSSSDQQTILHVARVPILFAKGFSNSDKLVIGAKSAAMAKNPEAELSYVEHSGQAIEAGRSSILDLEDRMRQVGAELLVQRPQTVTATQVGSEDEDNRSTLQKIVEEFEDSLEQCLMLMGLWIGEKSHPEVEIHKDFGSADLAGKHGDLLMNAVDKRVVSKRTARDHLKRADVLMHDVDEDEEVTRLGLERAQDLKDAQSKMPKSDGSVADPLL